jgi:phosphohistidine phosphatase
LEYLRNITIFHAKMRLYIIRHAAAEQGNYHKDFHRVLRTKGQQQLPKMSRFILRHPPKQLAAYCSTSQRTKQTYEGIKLGLNNESITFHDELYHASLQDLLDFIWGCDTQGKDVAIIGHNPGLSALATYFSGEEIFLRTGGIVVLEFPFESVRELSQDSGEITDKQRC